MKQTYADLAKKALFDGGCGCGTETTASCCGPVSNAYIAGIGYSLDEVKDFSKSAVGASAG